MLSSVRSDAPEPDAVGEHLRGFGPVGLLAIVAVLAGNSIFVPLSALLALLWAWRARISWSEIGFARPAHWPRLIIAGLAFGVAFKLLMKAVVMPLLGAPAVNPAFQFLVGNPAALPRILYLVLIGAAFGEEVVFRGYAFERLGRLFGQGTGAKIAIVLLTSAWFGADHYPLQGIAGVEQATIVGLTFGTIFAFTRQLWPLILAHGAFDLTAVAIIYWNVETKIAHLIFR